MTGSYDPWLVVLSFAVAALASYVALTLASRVSAAQGRAAGYWFVGGALAMGSGIWSMHFIGMLAFHLPIAMSYDLGIALLAMLIAVLVAGFALFTINRNVLSLRRLSLSGVLMGVGIAAMHYAGMEAMQISPAISYNGWLFAASIAIAIAASIVALTIAFRLRSESVVHVMSKRMASALVMGVAIVGMHYTGMAAANFARDSICLGSPGSGSQLWLAVGIAACTVVFLSVAAFDSGLTSRSAGLAEALHLANEMLLAEVHERKLAQADAHVNAMELRLIGDEMPAMVAYVDKELRYRYHNKRYEHWTGLMAEQIDGHSVNEVLGSELYGRIKIQVERVLSGIEVTHQFQHVGNDAVTRYFEARLIPRFSADGAVVGYYAMTQDISERKRAEEMLHHARGYLEQILNAIPTPIVVKDRQHRFLFVNQSAVAMMAPAGAQMIGKTDYDFVPKEQADVFCAQDQLVFSERKETINEESITDATGGDRTFLTRKAVFQDLAGDDVLVAVITDITGLKEGEQALRRSNEELRDINQKLQEAQSQLLQSEKMASIGHLAAGVAHEINNPIGFVYSNLGTLNGYLRDIFSLIAVYERLEDAPKPDDVDRVRKIKSDMDLEFLRTDTMELMKESRDGITRVKTIVQNLKDFSHQGVDEQWQWARLQDGLESTLNIVNNEIKYKAKVVKEYVELPDIECLPSQLNQVFMNLLVNAAHAIEDMTGTITLRTGKQAEEVWVEVADSGCGIDPDNLKRIFDPFFTTKPVGKGTGLGLSLSYGIVQKHHGRIEVRSELGKGTTFRIYLPVRQEHEVAEAQPA